MPHVKLRPTFNLDQVRLDELQKVVPEAFADGKINWGTLRAALAQHLEDEGEGAEHFGLNWPGKRKARKLVFTPSQGTLNPTPGEGVEEQHSANIYLEGENAEVLKLLQKSYAGRAKMIYIDPPYNTGNDFVYDDDFSTSLGTYLKSSGQADEDGSRLSTNTRSDGRFHSKWLSMVYPRLVLARNLLRDDGVIFISIDDNELHHLRQLVDEIFGEENFIAQLVILTNPKGRVMDLHFSRTHDYVLVYSKTPLENELSLPKSNDEVEEDYPERDADGKFRALELRNTHRNFGKFNRPNLWYPLYVDTKSGAVSIDKAPKLVEVYPRWDDGFEGCWTWGVEKARESNRLLIAREVAGRWKIFRKAYSHGADGAVARKKLKTILIDNAFYTERGQADLEDLLPGRLFQAPKPVALIQTLVKLATSGEDLVIDFFSGSATSAQAVLQQNADDGGNRSFILIQTPEETPADSSARKHGFATIAELGKERIRRAIKKIAKASGKKLGFRVFKLGPSNFRGWQDYAGGDIKELEDLFNGHKDPLRENWKKRDLVIEILLHEGIPLTAPVRKEQAVKKNEVLVVDSNGRRIFLCLDEKLYVDSLEAMTPGESDTLICLDSALTDEQKLRLADKGLLKTI